MEKCISVVCYELILLCVREFICVNACKRKHFFFRAIFTRLKSACGCLHISLALIFFLCFIFICLIFYLQEICEIL